MRVRGNCRFWSYKGSWVVLSGVVPFLVGSCSKVEVVGGEGRVVVGSRFRDLGIWGQGTLNPKD